ncbi:MAG: sensor histidine kinase N-terminal domain-containing protein [Betaproteobacteria bacterium]|nr:sensor histidine kinase N-terminal domain-containing protein [Betaproteobacteria bacterium]MBK7079902.1 sensor histidine kinase N-terminal domain-containing protein [Betaproteobacteria bacterium]MBK8688532.1 sensor histidine kinase N-terminal domain-containing protein [Betaproteobacteria bacterium]
MATKSASQFVPAMSFVGKFLEWLAAPLLFLWLATAFVGLFVMAGAAEEPYDQQLADAAQAVAARIVATGDTQRPVALPPEAARWLANDRVDTVYHVIRRADGTVIAGDAELPPVPGALADPGPTFHGGVVDGAPVRVASVAVDDPARAGGRLVVQVAETLHKRERLARRLQMQSIVPQLFVLAGAFALVWYGLGYVIAPMKRLNALIDHRGSADLSPLDPGAAPPELQPLLASINGLMARLAANFETQRRFIADAAHQLRTPLAGLQTQTELALAQSDPAALRASLTQLEASTQRTVHLANRLLSLARAGTRQHPEHERVDLTELVRETVAGWVPQAVEQGVDLGVETAPDGGPVPVRGDPLLLREMLSNLVDNAIRYTGSGGSVTVTVVGAPARELVVGDSGPGIPAADRTRVLQPFFRGAHGPVPGSGLGLAIVDEIARGHGATLTLGDNEGRRGTRVTVRFPDPDPQPH